MSRLTHRQLQASIAAIDGVTHGLAEQIARRLMEQWASHRVPVLAVDRVRRDDEIRAALDAQRSTRAIAAEVGIGHSQVVRIGKRAA